MVPRVVLRRRILTSVAVPFLLVTGLATGVVPLAAAPSDWLGSKACAGCHEAAFDAWKRGPHTQSRASLGADSNRVACLGCHASGEAPAGIALAGGVGCESCHGAGAGYAFDDVMRDRPLREALGLVSLSDLASRERVCRACHQQELRLTPFAVEQAWARLPHGSAKPASSAKEVP